MVTVGPNMMKKYNAVAAGFVSVGLPRLKKVSCMEKSTRAVISYVTKAFSSIIYSAYWSIPKVSSTDTL